MKIASQREKESLRTCASNRRAWHEGSGRPHQLFVNITPRPAVQDPRALISFEEWRNSQQATEPTVRWPPSREGQASTDISMGGYHQMPAPDVADAYAQYVLGGWESAAQRSAMEIPSQFDLAACNATWTSLAPSWDGANVLGNAPQQGTCSHRLCNECVMTSINASVLSASCCFCGARIPQQEVPVRGPECRPLTPYSEVDVYSPEMLRRHGELDWDISQPPASLDSGLWTGQGVLGWECAGCFVRAKMREYTADILTWRVPPVQDVFACFGTALDAITGREDGQGMGTMGEMVDGLAAEARSATKHFRVEAAEKGFGGRGMQSVDIVFRRVCENVSFEVARVEDILLDGDEWMRWHEEYFSVRGEGWWEIIDLRGE